MTQPTTNYDQQVKPIIMELMRRFPAAVVIVDHADGLRATQTKGLPSATLIGLLLQAQHDAAEALARKDESCVPDPAAIDGAIPFDPEQLEFQPTLHLIARLYGLAPIWVAILAIPDRRSRVRCHTYCYGSLTRCLGLTANWIHTIIRNEQGGGPGAGGARRTMGRPDASLELAGSADHQQALEDLQTAGRLFRAAVSMLASR